MNNQEDVKKTRSYALMANDLARKAVFNLTRNQFLILLYMMTKINRDDTVDRWYRISVQELCATLGWNLLVNPHLYDRIKADLKYLRSADWVKTTTGISLVSWLQNADYDNEIRINDNGVMTNYVQIKFDADDEEEKDDEKKKKERWNGMIHFRFDVHIAQYLIGLTGNFTLIDLRQVSNLVKPVSIRLYILLKSYVFKEKLDNNEPIFVKRALDELKKVMKCKSESQYKRTNPDAQIKYFVRDAIKPAVEEINKKTTEFHVEFDLDRDPYEKTLKNIKFMLTKPGYTQQVNAQNARERIAKK